MRPRAAQPGLAGRPRAHALVVLVVKKNLARGHNRLASRRRPSHSPFCSQGPNVMEDQDLREIGISDAQHRRKLLQAARSLPKVPPAVPRPWRGAGRAWEPPRGGLPHPGTPWGAQCPVHHFATFRGQQSPRDSARLVQPQEQVAWHGAWCPQAWPVTWRPGPPPEAWGVGQHRERSLPGELWSVGLSLSSALLMQRPLVPSLPRSEDAESQ